MLYYNCQSVIDIIRLFVGFVTFIDWKYRNALNQVADNDDKAAKHKSLKGEA